MVTRTFEQRWEDRVLKAYLNHEDRIFIAIHPDGDDYDVYQFQCTTLDLDDAIELYNELGELIKQMRDGQTPEN
jgi:fructose-1,6-bisphosphatase